EGHDEQRRDGDQEHGIEERHPRLRVVAQPRVRRQQQAQSDADDGRGDVAQRRLLQAHRGVLPQLPAGRQLDESRPDLAERHDDQRVGEDIGGHDLPDEDQRQEADDSARGPQRHESLVGGDFRVDLLDGYYGPHRPDERHDDVAARERRAQTAHDEAQDQLQHDAQDQAPEQDEQQHAQALAHVLTRENLFGHHFLPSATGAGGSRRL